MEDLSARRQYDEIADELGRAIEAGDVAAIGRLFSDDVVVWHSYDNIEMPRADILKMLSGIPERFDVFRATNIRRHVFEGGFVQQEDLVVKHKDGRDAVARVCMIFWVKDGRITKVNEYIDPTQLGF